MSFSRLVRLRYFKVSEPIHCAPNPVCRKLLYSFWCCRYVGPESTSAGALVHLPLLMKNTFDVFLSFSGHLVFHDNQITSFSCDLRPQKRSYQVSGKFCLPVITEKCGPPARHLKLFGARAYVNKNRSDTSNVFTNSHNTSTTRC